MANPTGESESDAVRVDFDRRLMLQFRGSAKALFSPSTSNCPSLHHCERGSPMKNHEPWRCRRYTTSSIWNGCRRRITSDVGLLAYRELDDAIGLTVMASDVLADARTGKNGRHALAGLFRQSVFGRLAGYKDVNDAERMIRRCAGLLAARRLRAVRLHRARWAASRRNGSRHPRTSVLLPICPASGSTLCTVAARREASCSTWIRA